MTELRECCADSANRDEQPQERPDLSVQVCRVCGRRHFELTVDPIRIAVRNPEEVSA